MGSGRLKGGKERVSRASIQLAPPSSSLFKVQGGVGALVDGASISLQVGHGAGASSKTPLSGTRFASQDSKRVRRHRAP